MKNTKPCNLFFLIIICILVLGPVSSFAYFGSSSGGGGSGSGSGGGTGTVGPPVGAGGGITNPIAPISDVASLIKIILEGVIKIGIPIVALALVYAGFMFVTARGNTEQLSKAKDALLYSLLGAALLLGSWALAQLITETVICLDGSGANCP